MSAEVKTFAAVAILGWLITAAAIVSMVLGNPTAINGVIGAGVGAATFTAAAVAMHRQDAR